MWLGSIPLRILVFLPAIVQFIDSYVLPKGLADSFQEYLDNMVVESTKKMTLKLHGE